jgi:hypothetical protein
VLVEQGPIRRRAASECQKVMSRLEVARADWRRFQTEDQPAYDRWVAGTFGTLLSEIRELESKVHAKRSLIEEVEIEYVLGRHRRYATAYAAVMKRREARFAPPPSEPREEPKGEAREQEDVFADEMLFEELLQTVFGVDPMKLSDREYRRMFQEFQEKMRGEPEAEAAEPEEERVASAAKPPESTGTSRLKELYRILVRRLHPDLRAEGEAEVSALWHDVQQAYETGNVERLEMLLAFTDIQDETTGEHTTVGQMLSVLKELRRSFNALMRSLRTAKQDVAWGFSRVTDRAPFARKVGKRLERQADSLRVAVESMDAQIEHWTNERPSRGKRKYVQDSWF